MTVNVTHAFVSAIADDPATAAAGGIVPSEWNANHTLAYPYAAKTANYQILATDCIIEVTANSPTLTMPDATLVIVGSPFILKNTGSGAPSVATTSAQTIDGASTLSLANGNQSNTLISNGTNWIII